jgi:hypothetical protein
VINRVPEFVHDLSSVAETHYVQGVNVCVSAKGAIQTRKAVTSQSRGIEQLSMIPVLFNHVYGLTNIKEGVCGIPNALVNQL